MSIIKFEALLVSKNCEKFVPEKVGDSAPSVFYFDSAVRFLDGLICVVIEGLSENFDKDCDGA